ncbi:exosortase family protein XrtF [Hyunsoonleella flava]|uniref:Exosortase family protein XrtF n=1 Tax=Hyunsoonleella flava TaxID=2527939 RepID=A0A4Q9FCI7_9FLAO|nr:exosortase family protein XrtF [Hyunsoonleella flava]TBN02716.1 exosortase family protein XrtF [Hyunsoonleella flava]
MKALFVKYKSVIKFILTFLLVYITLTVGYKFYLQFSDGSQYYPDYFTNLVAKQCEAVLTTFGYNTQVVSHPKEASMKLLVNGNYLARVIEGCNSISVIILFLSFVVAFSGKLKTTLLFIFAGSVLIYTINLFRIVFLAMGLYHYPEYQDVLHTVIFPAIIYGTVFLLWVFWVNRCSKLNQNHA